MARVLLVDNDASLRAELTATLTASGHEVESASSGKAGIAVASESRPDIVVFDLLLGDMSGIELCRALRTEQGWRPRLCVLTAAAAEADRVAAFEAGADDYVTKPHSTRELVLRLRSLARRGASSKVDGDEIVVGTLTIDRASRRVAVAGLPIELTRREFDLLVRLADPPGRVLARHAMVSDVWEKAGSSVRVVDTTIKRLRRKLGHRAPEILTVRGVGYRLGDESLQRSHPPAVT